MEEKYIQWINLIKQWKLINLLNRLCLFHKRNGKNKMPSYPDKDGHLSIYCEKNQQRNTFKDIISRSWCSNPNLPYLQIPHFIYRNSRQKKLCGNTSAKLRRIMSNHHREIRHRSLRWGERNLLGLLKGKRKIQYNNKLTLTLEIYFRIVSQKNSTSINR